MKYRLRIICVFFIISLLSGCSINNTDDTKNDEITETESVSNNIDTEETEMTEEENYVDDFEDDAEELEKSEEDIVEDELSVIAESEVGDVVCFGKFEQNNNYEDGKEQIEWIVLEKEDGWNLLLSKNALLCLKYGNNHEVNIVLDEDYFGYQNSEISFYLEGGFIEEAFSKTEQEYIDYKMISCDNNNGRKNNYNYRVFILNKEEVDYYKECITCTPEITEYARYFNNSDSDNQIWLRTTYGDDDACLCDMSYEVSDDNHDSSAEKHFVCPAIWIYSGDEYSRKNAIDDSYINSITDGLSENKIEVGDIVSYGSYEQDNIEKNGKEDIEWIVLNKDDDSRIATLVSKDVIEYYQYNIHGDIGEYYESDLYNSLNSDFYQNAFSDEEKSILTSFKENDYYVDLLSWSDYCSFISDRHQSISRYTKKISEPGMINQIRLYMKTEGTNTMDVLIQFNETDNEIMSQVCDESVCRQYYHVRPVIRIRY